MLPVSYSEYGPAFESLPNCCLNYLISLYINSWVSAVIRQRQIEDDKNMRQSGLDSLKIYSLDEPQTMLSRKTSHPFS